MKKTLMVIGFVAYMLPACLHASSGQELKGAYQPATVVSVTKLSATVNYAYDIGIRADCTLYVARYKSAHDYVPIEIAPNRTLNVLVDEPWMSVALSPDHFEEMRLISVTPSGGKPCADDLNGLSATIPAGTIIPVSLDSTIRSDRGQPGAAITATVMQDVPLGMGAILRAGSKVTGHVVAAIGSGRLSDEAKISFQFDQIRFGNQTLQVTTNLRAVASRRAVLAAIPQISSIDNPDDQIQIGGDEISYGPDGPVMLGSEVVGKSTSQGVLAYVGQGEGTECRGAIDGNAHPQALWLFSVDACGAYGFEHLKVLHAGRTEPVGRITLTSDKKTVKVGEHSGLLLRVDRSGAEKTEAQVISSPATAR
jgi:hypothetical protein